MIEESTRFRQTVTVEIEVEINGFGPTGSIPSFWEEVGTINDADCPFERIGRSAINPLVFYLFARDGSPLEQQNHGFILSMNIQTAFDGLIRQFDTLNDEARAWWAAEQERDRAAIAEGQDAAKRYMESQS
jgi:hypothetical protein